MQQLLQLNHPENFIGVYDLLPNDLLLQERLKDLRLFFNQAEARSRSRADSQPITLAFLTMDAKPAFLIPG
jgi:hypothetical protein